MLSLDLIKHFREIAIMMLLFIIKEQPILKWEEPSLFVLSEEYFTSFIVELNLLMFKEDIELIINQH